MSAHLIHASMVQHATILLTCMNVHVLMATQVMNQLSIISVDTKTKICIHKSIKDKVTEIAALNNR